jgi:hypothetical protein
MCQTFFKESVQQYVKSIEPVMVSQCCDMVKSFWSGHQQAKGKEAFSGSIINTQPHMDNEIPLVSNTSLGVQHSEILEEERAQPNSHSKTDPSAGTFKCLECGSERVLGQDHICSILQQNKSTILSTTPASNFASIQRDGKDSHSGLSSSAISHKVDGDSSHIFAREDYTGSPERLARNEGKSDTWSVKSTPYAADKLHTSPSKSKRNTLSNDNGACTNPASPIKKLRISPHNTAKSAEGAQTSQKACSEPSPPHNCTADPRATSRPSSNAKSSGTLDLSGDDGVITRTAKLNLFVVGHESNTTSEPSAKAKSSDTLDSSGDDGVVTKTAQLNLSALGHKKRALKSTVSMFIGEKGRGKKIALSEFEKNVFFAATKRIGPLQK